MCCGSLDDGLCLVPGLPSRIVCRSSAGIMVEEVAVFPARAANRRTLLSEAPSEQTLPLAPGLEEHVTDLREANRKLELTHSQQRSKGSRASRNISLDACVRTVGCLFRGEKKERAREEDGAAGSRRGKRQYSPRSRWFLNEWQCLSAGWTQGLLRHGSRQWRRVCCYVQSRIGAKKRCRWRWTLAETDVATRIARTTSLNYRRAVAGLEGQDMWVSAASSQTRTVPRRDSLLRLWLRPPTVLGQVNFAHCLNQDTRM
jgi:hypothetical protein